MQTESNDLIIFILVSTILILIMGAFIITMVFLYRKRQSKHIRDLEKLRLDHEKDLLKTQLEMQEETFLMMSREIHDNINLSLTLAKLNLNSLTNMFNEKNISTLNEPIRLISKAITELTDLSRAMNSDIIKECGLITALSYEIERLKKLINPKIHYELTGNPVFMDSQKELLVFRIIQEAFNNILKHAKAKNIYINLHYSKADLKIDIQDDGNGFLKTQYKKISKTFPPSGLMNIQKRMLLLNGEFDLTTEPGTGTRLILKLPFLLPNAD